MNRELFMSSQLFLISISYSIIRSQFLLTFSLITTYTGSSLFYIFYKENGFFHKLDIVTSRTTCVFNLMYTLIYMRPIYISFILLHNMVLTYIISCIMYYNKNPLWYKCHIYFHIWTNITALIIITEIYMQNQYTIKNELFYHFHHGTIAS